MLDLGTGTGSVARGRKIGPTGRIMAVDISPEMLDKTRARIRVSSLTNVEVVEGRAEAIPASAGRMVLASLSLMYLIDQLLPHERLPAYCDRAGALWQLRGLDRKRQYRSLCRPQVACAKPPVRGVGPGVLRILSHF